MKNLIVKILGNNYKTTGAGVLISLIKIAVWIGKIPSPIGNDLIALLAALGLVAANDGGKDNQSSVA